MNFLIEIFGFYDVLFYNIAPVIRNTISVHMQEYFCLYVRSTVASAFKNIQYIFKLINN